MAKKSLDDIFEEYVKEQVKDAGGQYVGVQDCEGMKYDLVLFNSPKTGSTLTVKTTVDDIRAAVADRLETHEEEWRKIKHETQRHR